MGGLLNARPLISDKQPQVRKPGAATTTVTPAGSRQQRSEGSDLSPSCKEPRSLGGSGPRKEDHPLPMAHPCLQPEHARHKQEHVTKNGRTAPSNQGGRAPYRGQAASTSTADEALGQKQSTRAKAADTLRWSRPPHPGRCGGPAGAAGWVFGLISFFLLCGPSRAAPQSGRKIAPPTTGHKHQP